MPDRIGLELLADRVRAAVPDRRGRAARATAEVTWDPERPEAAVAELRAAVGAARGLGVAVGLAFLDVQRVSLPPVRGDARRRMIALDPSRTFPLREPVVVALADDAPPAAADRGEPAFALSREQLRRWTAALEAWAPVESVEPAPSALARALAARDAAGDGEHRLPAGAGEEGVVRLAGGRVAEVRRAPRWDDAPAAGAAPHDPWLVALGAALGADEAPAAVLLLTDDLAQAAARRRGARLTRAAALCGLAAGLALAAADRQRARHAAAVERGLRAERPRAAAAESLYARLQALDAAARAAAALEARRADPLAVLEALGERLPAGAAVTALRQEGDAWTVDGTARDAAALVPALAADPRLAEVRALAPSTRFAEGGVAVETFSVAFRAAPAGGAP
jgi:Tfp pilus assembly protein PilN